jgi:hypothetical protein
MDEEKSVGCHWSDTCTLLFELSTAQSDCPEAWRLWLEGGKLLDTIDLRPGPVPQDMPPPPAEVEPIDLESRKSVYISLQLVAEGEELSLVKSADKLQFVATMMPGDEKVSKRLPGTTYKSPRSPGPMRQGFLCRVSRVHSPAYIRHP